MAALHGRSSMYLLACPLASSVQSSPDAKWQFQYNNKDQLPDGVAFSSEEMTSRRCVLFFAFSPHKYLVIAYFGRAFGTLVL